MTELNKTVAVVVIFLVFLLWGRANKGE